MRSLLAWWKTLHDEHVKPTIDTGIEAKTEDKDIKKDDSDASDDEKIEKKIIELQVIIYSKTLRKIDVIKKHVLFFSTKKCKNRRERRRRHKRNVKSLTNVSTLK